MLLSTCKHIRRLIIAVLVAAPLYPAISARATPGGSLYLPLLVDSGAPWPDVEAAPTPPPVEWSQVLDRSPRFPSARLDLFELRPESVPGEAVALYSTGSVPEPEVLDWYRRVLAAYGWRLESESGEGQRWHHYHGWLSVSFVEMVDGARRLQLARNLEAASRPDGTILDSGVPVPEGARRLRFDRLDLLAEELTASSALSEVRRDAVSRLAASGWTLEREASLDRAQLLGFDGELGSNGLIVALRPVSEAVVEIGIGEGQCWPLGAAETAERQWSVYLAGVPSPSGASITAFERNRSARTAVERWQSSCHDLDLLAALYRAAFESAGWVLQPTGDVSDVLREPGRLDIRVAPEAGGPPVAVTARTAGGGSLSIRLERDEAGRSSPEGRSLLFDDIPLPPGSDPIRMAQDLADGWRYREWYAATGAAGDELVQWFRTSMAASGWTFERREPRSVGRSLVYHAGGEELLFDFDTEDEQLVVISRRRICESEEPSSVPDHGQPARNLSEMPVYPGAEFVRFSEPEESYEVRCASLSGLSEWYRRAMEQGDWRLAAIEGPEDPFQRRLVFVRPEEIGLEPEERTAWGQVELVREWPYQYGVLLSRDPGGILPSQRP